MKKIVLLAISLLLFGTAFSQEKITYKKGVLTLPNGVVFNDGDMVMLGIGSGPKMEFQYVMHPRSLFNLGPVKTITSQEYAFQRYIMLYAQNEKNSDGSHTWYISIGDKEKAAFRCDIIKALETGEVYKQGYNKEIVDARRLLYNEWEEKLRNNEDVKDLSFKSVALHSGTPGTTSDYFTTPEEAANLTFDKLSVKLDAAANEGIITTLQSTALKETFDPNQAVWIVEAINQDFITKAQGDLLKKMELPSKVNIVDWLDLGVKAGIITPQQSTQMRQAGKKYVSDVLDNSVKRKIITQTQCNQLKEKILK